MAVDITSILQADSPAELATLVTAAIADGKQPVGLPFVIGQQSGVTKLVQFVGTGTGNAVTAYQVVSDQLMSAFADKLETALGTSGALAYGPTVILGDTSAYREFVQVIVVGTIAGGGGGSVTLPALATASELQTGTETGQRMFSPKLIHDEVARQIAAIPPA